MKVLFCVIVVNNNYELLVAYENRCKWCKELQEVNDFRLMKRKGRKTRETGGGSQMFFGSFINLEWKLRQLVDGSRGWRFFFDFNDEGKF